MCTTGERSFVPEASGGGALFEEQSDRSVNSLLAFKTEIIIIYIYIFMYKLYCKLWEILYIYI